MISRTPKPDLLSATASKLWDAVNNCEHTRYAIAKKSGVPITSFKRFLLGTAEPSQFDFECLIEAIEILNNEGPAFKWRDHIKEAKKLLDTHSLQEVAEHFGKSADQVRCALQYAERRKAA